MRFATHLATPLLLAPQSEMNVPISGCATLESYRKTKTNFERFVRATNCDYQFEGAGLGLSIVQAIAQAHGGWVFSAAWVMDLLSQS